MRQVPDPVGPVLTLQTAMGDGARDRPAHSFARISGVPRFMTPESAEMLRQAVRKLEAHSSVEMVVAHRPSSGSYAHIDLAVGIAAGMATLAFLLYCPWPIAWHFLLATPLLAGAIAGLTASRMPTLRRALSKEKTMEESVARAARAAFVESGIHHTEYRSGVLLFLSSLERSAALVADSAVELALPQEEWHAFSQKLNERLREGAGANEIAKVIESVADRFAQHLPRHDEDINELPDGVSE